VSAPNPQNALGIMAMGTFVASPVSLTANTPVPITNSLAVTLTAARRYRIVVELRAVTLSVAGPSFLRIALRNGGTAVFADTPLAQVNNQFNTLAYQWVLTGDGAAKTFTVTLHSEGWASTAYTDQQAFFYVEDVGPVRP
jgi:hypothetical protein